MTTTGGAAEPALYSAPGQPAVAAINPHVVIGASAPSGAAGAILTLPVMEGGWVRGWVGGWVGAWVCGLVGGLAGG